MTDTMDASFAQDTSGESQEIVDAPSQDTELETSEAPEQTPEEIAEEEFELTVDGKSERIKKSELLKRASHASAAAKRMQEATKAKADATRLMNMLKENPLGALKELDGTFDQKAFLTKKLAELMDEEMLSPEERQTRQDLAELNSYRQKTKEAEEAKQREELDALAASTQKSLDDEIGEAIKSAGLPRTNSAVKRLATYMLEATEAGLTISTAKLAAQVKKDIQDEVMDLLNTSDDEAFSAILGSDLLTKAQKLSLKKIKTPGAPVAPTAPRKTEEANNRTTSTADFLKEAGIF
jgi:hypothetical protein